MYFTVINFWRYSCEYGYTGPIVDFRKSLSHNRKKYSNERKNECKYLVVYYNIIHSFILFIRTFRTYLFVCRMSTKKKSTTETLVPNQTIKQKGNTKPSSNTTETMVSAASSTVSTSSTSSAPPNHLFMNGKLKQQNGHMIMTNVYRPTRKKYLNIDSRFHDGYQTTREKEKGLASFHYTLPQTIFDVKSIRAKVVELPHSFYNYSENAKNTFVHISGTGITDGTYKLPDGHYQTVSDLITELNTDCFPSGITATYDGFNMKTTIKNTTGSPVTLKWNIDKDGSTDRYDLQSKLGWCLGFREDSVTIEDGNGNGDGATGEGIVNVCPFKYLYLVVDDYLKSNPSSFISPLRDSFLNKSILSRISINSTTLTTGQFGNSIISVPTYNLISDTRTYMGKSNLQKMKIEVVNEWGHVMDLNSIPISFCLEVDYE